MFSYKEFCEFMTHGGYSWFYLDKQLTYLLEQSELSECHIESTNDPDIVRVWYPKNRWTDRPIAKEELSRMMMRALEESDWDLVKKLKEKMK